MTTIPASTDPVSALSLSTGEINFYNEFGFLVIPGLIDEVLAGKLNAEVTHIMKQIGLSMEKLKQTAEYLAGSVLESYIHSRNLCHLAAQLTGGPASVYTPFTAVKGPGGGRFHFHQDNQYTRLDGPALNLWTALGPMSPENGCLQVVPASHRHGTLDSVNADDGDAHRKVKFEPADFLPLRMRPGDAVAFSRLTVHGSGPDQTINPRVAYAVQFHRDDVNWLDANSGQWKRLKEFPRWRFAAVEKISVPTGRVDGH